MKTKLVRDKIPQIIIDKGVKPEYYIAINDKEYERRLFDKMKEELQEFIDNPCIEEAADMYEVWNAIIEHWGMIPIDVISQSNKKKKERGGFTNRIILNIP